MNALELADKLQEFDVYVEVILVDKSGYPYADFDCITNIADEAATMLRQQQAEIEKLKQKVAFLEDWSDKWQPTIKQLMNINVKVQEK